MIQYSHVNLIILGDESSGDIITERLGVQPTEIRVSKAQIFPVDGTLRKSLDYAWMLSSPKSHSEADPTGRLLALADIIEPFADRLPSLAPEYQPRIDIVYHTTPQYSSGITGEFNWFRMPAKLMEQLAGWNLDVSYEVIWFDHPEWRQSPFRKWINKLAKFKEPRKMD